MSTLFPSSTPQIPRTRLPGGGGECGLNRVYLAAGCVCVGRNPETSCQIDTIWCSSVPGPREVNNLNPEASAIFKLSNSRPELNNLNNLNILNRGEGFRGPGIK